MIWHYISESVERAAVRSGKTIKKKTMIVGVTLIYLGSHTIDGPRAMR